MRFTISTLFATVAIAACVVASLRYPTELWVDLIASIAFGSLGVSLVGALTLRGRSRAFCLGFATLALMRALIDYRVVNIFNVSRDSLFPFKLLRAMADKDLDVDGLTYFLRAHWSVILTGAFGGVCGWLFYRSRESTAPARLQMENHTAAPGDVPRSPKEIDRVQPSSRG